MLFASRIDPPQYVLCVTGNVLKALAKEFQGVRKSALSVSTLSLRPLRAVSRPSAISLDVPCAFLALSSFFEPPRDLQSCNGSHCGCREQDRERDRTPWGHPTSLESFSAALVEMGFVSQMGDLLLTTT